MKIYLPIAKVDAAQRMVYGYASTEARDDQGEIIKRDAMAAALADYMKFGNIREMHQLSAVGKAKDAAVDDKGLYVGAKVVDEDAWQKVLEGVYSGYSIGGKVTARDPVDYKTITGLRLDEISLVDRPANPEAVFDCYKRGAADPAPDGDDRQTAAEAIVARAMAELQRVLKGGDAKGDGDKPYGDVKYADPGYQSDKKKRYPIDSEAHIRAAWSYINKPKNSGKYSAEQVKSIKAKIVAAWKDKIDPKGPPSADDEAKAARASLQKHLWNVGSIASVILQLDEIADELALEAFVEQDDSPAAEKLRATIKDLCGQLNALVAEETSELMDGDGDDDEMAMAAIASSLTKSGLAGRAKGFEDRAEKARRTAGDQALLDVAHHAVTKAAGMDGLTAGEKGHMAECAKCLKAAGASEEATQDTANNPTHAAPQAALPGGNYVPGHNSTVNTAKVRGKAHQALMDVAHGCIGKLTDGKSCAAEKAGARHSKETMAHLQEAHDHLTAAGAKCDAAGTGEEEGEGTEFDGKAVGPGDLRKALIAEKARGDTLAKGIADLTEQMAGIGRTVEQIARTPLPPLTRSAAGLTRIEKGGPDNGMSDEELTAAIGAMSPDEQAMLLIKAARTRPIRIANIPGTAGAANG